MAADTLAAMSEGRVVEDSRQDDEEEMRELRAAHRLQYGAEGATLTAKRQQYLESLPRTMESPEMKADLDATAVPAPTAGRLVVQGDDLLEAADNPWGHSIDLQKPPGQGDTPSQQP